MNETIKQIAMGAFNASNPVNVLTGTVANVDPIEIDVHQKLRLTKNFIVLTECVIKYEVELNESRIVIRPGLAKGDKVVLLRMQGGQQYIVMDKVV